MKGFSHLAGDGSFREKKSSKSLVNSGLIYSYLKFPILKIFDPGVQKIFLVFSLKLAKLIGVCEANFFSKIECNRFFYNKIRTN